MLYEMMTMKQSYGKGAHNDTHLGFGPFVPMKRKFMDLYYFVDPTCPRTIELARNALWLGG